MHSIFLLVSLTSVLFTSLSAHQPDELLNRIKQKAYCIVPICDVVNRPLANAQSSHEAVTLAYKNIPISWGPHSQDKAACPRIHQLLLHEIVHIIDETEHEVAIEIPDFKTINKENKLESIKGWVLKEHLRSLDTNSIRHLPESLSSANNQMQVLALVSPFMDEDYVFYSAGTRFAMLHEARANQIKERASSHNYHAWAYDAYLKKFKIIELPQQICAYNTQSLPLQERKELFCDLITLWATYPLFIPLVWGGASIGKAWEHNDYYAASHGTESGETLSVWERPKYGEQVYQGIDASNLVARAAQTVGIDYQYRNTSTAAAFMDELYMYEWPENGDLIWVPGGMLIINKLERNRAVSAFSYGAGYGIVVELPLAEIFKDISTYDDLMQAYRSKTPLTLLNQDGSIARTINEYKILRFARD